ncbi:MAG: IS4 family transposase [Treponema sp.]|nr:IS4 family transposase [Treponema sp.]
MVKSTKALEAIRRISEYLNSDETVKRRRTHEKAFTRKRKLSFSVVVGMLLNSLTKSLQIEVDDFFEYVLTSVDTVSKQAYSKARQNVKPDFLRELSEIPAEVLYKDANYKTWRGYRLLAVDGSTLELPNFEHLRMHFNHVGNQAETVRAKASALFDLENSMILASEIDHYRLGEREFARRHLTWLKESGYRKDLLLYDRGYPSRELMAYHIDEGLDFVMRVKDSFLSRKKLYRGEEDYIQNFYHKDKVYTVRRVVFLLKSGDVETLLTTLPENFSLSDLKEIYGKRWGIETEFYALKHKIQIENFSGYTVTAILQDFYAGICLANIAAIFANDADFSGSPQRKYTYKENSNLLLGKFKHRLVKALLQGAEESLNLLFAKVTGSIARRPIPIRPGRIVTRGKKRRPIKHPPNQKRAV